MNEPNYMYGNLNGDLNGSEAGEYVLVETIETFRQRYVIPTPLGHDEWALDTVACEEGTEFSQEYLGETIVTHRRITKNEALRLCDEDNDYASDWPEEQKIRAFFSDRIMEDGRIVKVKR